MEGSVGVAGGRMGKAFLQWDQQGQGRRGGSGQHVAGWVGVVGTQWWGVAGDDVLGLLKGLAVPQGREEFLRRVTGAGFTRLCGGGMSCRLLEP